MKTLTFIFNLFLGVVAFVLAIVVGYIVIFVSAISLTLWYTNKLAITIYEYFNLETK